MLRDASAAGCIERFLAGLIRELTGNASHHVQPDSPPVHRLPMDRSFLDFLRLSAGIQRIGPDRARTLKGHLDQELHGFARGKGPHGT